MSDLIRFQGDADLNHDIVRGLWRLQPALDFQTAEDAGLVGVTDPGVIAYAAIEKRILVSHDLRTMPQHFSAFLSSGQASCGLILIQQKLPVRTAIEWLHLVWCASTAEEWQDRLEYLP